MKSNLPSSVVTSTSKKAQQSINDELSSDFFQDTVETFEPNSSKKPLLLPLPPMDNESTSEAFEDAKQTFDSNQNGYPPLPSPLPISTFKQVLESHALAKISNATSIGSSSKVA